MAQRSITSFFARKPVQNDNDEDKKTEDSPIKTKCVSKEEDGCSPVKNGKRKRSQVICSDEEEETTSKTSPIKSPAKKKPADDRSEETEKTEVEEKNDRVSPFKRPYLKSDKKNVLSTSSQLQTETHKINVLSKSSQLQTETRGDKLIRKTAKRMYPPNSPLCPAIKKLLEEQEKRRLNSVEDDSSNDLEDCKPLPQEDSEDEKKLVDAKSNKESKDCKPLPQEDSEDEKKPVDPKSNKESEESEDKRQKLDDKSGTESVSKLKDTTPKSTVQKKVSPKSKLSIFQRQPSSPSVKSDNIAAIKIEVIEEKVDDGDTIPKEETKSVETDTKPSPAVDSDVAIKTEVKEENLNDEDKNPKEDPELTEADTKDKEEASPKKSESPEKETPKESQSSKESPKKKEIHPLFAGKKDKDKKAVASPPEPGADYDPSKSKYHPIDDAFWKHGDKVPYLALARTLEKIESVSARLKMIEILSNYLRSVIVLSPEDLLPSIYLCLNKIAPEYHNLELGVAENTLHKMIAQNTGRSMAQIKADAKAAGDLGIVAEQSRSTQRYMFKPAPLTVRGVFHKLREIAQMSGQAVIGKKVDKIQSMFAACRYSEARFFVRSVNGKLRIGLAEQSVLQALAQACATTPPGQEYPPEKLNVASSMSENAFKARLDEEALIIKTTYCECPNYDLLIPVLLEEGVRALPQRVKLTPGIPLKPMLAHPTKGVSEVLERFDGLRFTCEWKYDGERAQIHLSEDGKVSIYSRNQENNTSKYPDIVSRLPSCLGPGVTSCVLDTEAVAWDKVNKRIQPFQVLSTRKRKDCLESEIKVQVCVFMFDLLYLNGEPLVKKTLVERRRLLQENFKAVEEQFVFATSLDTSSVDEVQEFLEESVRGNCEGLMVKTLETEATYEIAKRSRNWLKLKKDYLEGVGDTLDLVVIGGYLGKGKRTGVYGGFLLACYSPDSEEYQSICKIGTGFSDEALQKHSETLKEQVIPSPRPYYRFDTSHEPDHWFDASTVWEVKCADLSLSPVHRAAIGIVDPDHGISLRFPRFIRIREDKPAEEATSAQQVADMYNNQDQIKNQKDSNKFAEEDFY